MISILLATTGRPDLAVRCCREIRATTNPFHVEIVAAVDHDPETRIRLNDLADKLDYSDEYRGSANAWNDALRIAAGDPVVLAADDLRWQPGWLEAALATLAEFPGGWGMVGLNDGHHGEELSTHYMLSRRLIIEVFGGRVAWSCYGHSFQDREANERARAAGRYAWCENARVGHEHWIFGDRPQDDTDRLALAGHAASHAIFEQRQRAGFPDVELPVIK